MRTSTNATRRRVAGLAGALAAAAALLVPSASAVSGELRTLYVLATWGPEPFGSAELQRTADETNDFFEASSSGRFAMPGSVAGPLRLPRAVFDSCDATVLREASPPATFAGYARIVFVTPIVPACNFHGEANPTEVLLNGRLHTALAAHELGHTLDLGHASRWDCATRPCSLDEYGNGFSVMGGGAGDFNAFEKAKLGWLAAPVSASGNGVYEIGPVDAPTTLPQALVVTTASSELWLESRSRATPAFLGDREQAAGVAVVAGPKIGSIVESRFPRDNLLLPNPGGDGRFAYAAGERFVEPGVFQVTVERHTPESAALRLQWLERTAPGRPRVRLVATRPGRVRVVWDPATERGSGVRTYTVLADGRTVGVVDGQVPFLDSAATLVLSKGWHRVAVYATDRAGNRGRPGTLRVRVP